MRKPGKSAPKTDAPERITADELDRRFDDGEDVGAYFDWGGAQQPNLAKRRVNLDFPAWMVRSLDVQARQRGVTRQALIKMWLADRLEGAGQSRGRPNSDSLPRG